MLRPWINRNSTLLALANFHIHRAAENSVLERCRACKLHRAWTAGQKRSNHGDGRNVAYMAHEEGTPLVDITMGQLLGTAAERWPNKECLVSIEENVRVTFSELVRRADRLAAGLLKLGMKRGDRLGMWGPNDIEWCITFMCAVRAGFILVAINPVYQMDELAYCLRKVGVKAVVSPLAFRTHDYPRMLLDARRTYPTLEHVIIYSKDHVTGTRRFRDVEELATKREVERVAASQDEMSCRDGCNIQFTSGTTGRPKATLLSHRSIVNNSRLACERAEMTQDHRVCLNVPFFHAFGIVKGTSSMLHTGLTLVLPARSFNPVKSLEAMLQEKCDVGYGTPTMWINMLDAYHRLNPPPIRLSCGVTGGAPAPPALFQNLRECFHLDNMKTIYGLTETTAVIFQTLPGEDRRLTETTVGHLCCHVETMVVDDKGSPVPFGTVGELWVRGYSTMMKYWDDEENTEKSFAEDGWLKTGDQFILRADGYGHIVGRQKDMLIRGGENIFPKEVEDFLMTHPLLLEAQVIGAYDSVYGEEVCACVRLKHGARLTKEELRNYCKGKIAHFKIPRHVEFVDEFPKTASGKVQKYILKQELERKGIIPAAPKEDAVTGGS